MTRRYRVISCDGHLEIPPDAWVRHVPAEHLDRAPRLVKLRTGGEGWIVEGSPLIHNGQNVAAGRPLKGKGGAYWGGAPPRPASGWPSRTGMASTPRSSTRRSSSPVSSRTSRTARP